VAVSAADRERFVELYAVDPDRVVEVPNGSDTERFTPAPRDAKEPLREALGLPARPTVVYAAAGPKVADLVGLRWVRSAAANLGNTTFLVVGGVSPPFVEGNVIATGFVPDPVPYFQAADIAVCPIEYGGGTKLKLFDSLAAGLPSVVFEEALHGTDFRHGEEVWIAEKSISALTTAVSRLLEDQALADRLSVQGRELVVVQHDWKDSARRLEAALLSILQPHG
jgi:glycosyltransferase involved in cell wall biosynthesis